ncbi:glycosyltransferase family 4 protein [Novosphingobium beihaiensis]|uniref:Glycosyltransferase family 4 protein n=1 Tax=Novosphingobium beihaiensis TaxID=2930389 RepID=A0ABT0BV14_9SPHN|nr:glycosyltransferase family 4 protein [Novosphingobium beihaiensis]MCJ2188718.1 glycosyltransferase family 4 protein [Novosphingobium beihaiensis]
MSAIIFYPEVEAFGGEERVLLGLSHALHVRGIAHRIVCYFDHVGLQRHADWQLDLVILNPNGGAWSKARALKAYLAGQSPLGQVLLFGIQAAVHAGLAGLTGYSVRVADTPSLQTLPRELGTLTRLKQQAQGWMFMRMAKRGFRRADGVIANANYLGVELRSLYGVKPATIYIGAKEALPAIRKPLHARMALGPHLLSVSRLEPNKRIDWLIEAFETVVRTRPDTRLVLDIAGAGAEAAMLQSKCTTLGLNKSVVFHGFVSEADLEKLYGNAAMFVMPAVQGFGLPALEALARETPVVMHRQSGASEIFENSAWVSVFDGGPEALAAAILDMLDRIESGSLAAEEAPRPPSEDDFGAEIARYCGWLGQ